MHILPKCFVTELYVCVWGVGVCLCARASVCGCARTCIMSHAFLMGSAKQQMTTTTNTSMRDTYNANIEKAEKEWKGRGQMDRDWILGIQGPAVSFHLTRLPGHGCVGDGSL